MEFQDKIYFYEVKVSMDLSNFYKCNFECFINNNIVEFNYSNNILCTLNVLHLILIIVNY